MERKQNLKEPRSSASAAAPKPARKQSDDEVSASPQQGVAPNPGAPLNQGTSGQNAGEQDLLQKAKQAGGEIVNQVQQKAGSQFAEQKESAASDLSHVVQAVRRFGESLAGEQGSGPIARYAAEYGDKAAESLERFSTYIREQDPKQLLNDVQNFGRRRPVLLIGGAFLLGFAGARLLKSSMEQVAQHSDDDKDVRNLRPSQPNVPAPRPVTPRVTAARPATNPNAI